MLRVFGSAAREVRDVVRAATPTHRRLRDHLVTVAVATVGVDVLCAIAAFLLERHGQKTELSRESGAPPSPASSATDESIGLGALGLRWLIQSASLGLGDGGDHSPIGRLARPSSVP